MADVFTYEVDTSKWDTLMSELNARQLKTAWKAGLRPSAKTIERGVQSALSTHHPNAVKYSKEIHIKLWSKGSGFTVNLSQGQIEFARSKSGKMVQYSHLFILRWLSAGTNDRRTGKGYFRGSIKPSHFFAEGVKQSIDPAVSALGDNITKALERAYSKALAAKAAPQK